MDINFNQSSDKENRLRTIDLKEEDGGPQLIIAHKAISEKDCYVFTLGDAPKNEPNVEQNNVNANAKESTVKNFINGFLNRVPGLNKHKDEQNQANKEREVKLRCFKLSFHESDEEYDVEEYLTPKAIGAVAREFGTDKTAPEMSK